MSNLIDEFDAKLEAAFVEAIHYAYTSYTAIGEYPIARAVECISARPNAMVRSVDITLRVPLQSQPEGDSEKDGAGVGGHPRLIPILQTRRGGLLDGLRIVGPDGRPVTILPRSFAKALATGIVLHAWEYAFSMVDSDRLRVLRKRAAELPNLPAGESIVCSRTLREEVQKIINSERLSVDFRAVQRLLLLFSYFSKRNIIWAFMDGFEEGMATFSYTFRSPTQHKRPRPDTLSFRIARSRAKGGVRGFSSRIWGLLNNSYGLVRGDPAAEELVRMSWGQPPNYWLIPVGLPHMAESYHLSVEMPDGTFCSSQSLVHWSGDLADDPESVDDQSYGDYRGESLTGSGYSHLYTFRAPVAIGRPLYARISFRERPPGVTGAAYLFGLTLSTFCTFIAIIFPLLLKLPSGSVDAAALLLAVPSLISAWLLHDARPGTSAYVQAPVLSSLSLILFACVPIMQALLLVLTLGEEGMLDDHGWIVSMGVPWLVSLILVVPTWLTVVRLARANRLASHEFRSFLKKLP